VIFIRLAFSTNPRVAAVGPLDLKTITSSADGASADKVSAVLAKRDKPAGITYKVKTLVYLLCVHHFTPIVESVAKVL
jgi:hypothetical protein